MGKRSRDETGEERKARKQRKKDAKKQKKDAMRQTEPGTDASPTSSSGPSHNLTHAQTSEESSFRRKRLVLIVSLYPSALDDVLSQVKNSLQSMLLRYSDGVGGILLAFDNVRLVSDEKTGQPGHGIILNELPQVHYLVNVDALVFCPLVGRKLTGVVNECFPSHVGLLVHTFFNAMVSADHMHSAGYVFDQDLQAWTQDEGTGVLGTDDHVDFFVQTIHECAGVISMEGSNPCRNSDPPHSKG